MALALLRSCEAAVKPQLQKFLTTLILSPISSNSDLHQHCYTLIYQVTSLHLTSLHLTSLRLRHHRHQLPPAVHAAALHC